MSKIAQDVTADPFFSLAASTATAIGNEFLAAVVRNLHGIMPVSLCFIAVRMDDNPERVRGLYSWRDGVMGSPVQYDLEGTPCKLVYDDQVIIVPEALAEKFPKEPSMRQSYCGFPIKSNDDFIIGHFAVFANEPISQLEQIEGIVRIFGMRIEAELQRLANDEKLKQLIDRLNSQHRAVMRSNHFMSQVLAMVAHDLRNPLAAIIGRAEFIGNVLETEDVERLSIGPIDVKERIAKAEKSILNAATRMERMIADLLDAARKENANIALHPVKLNLPDPVKQAVQLCLDGAKKKNIQIEETYDDSVFVYADADRLVEAVGNLIGNAVKYSPPNGVVSLAAGFDVEDGFAEICVSDNGQGMSEEDLALAFQPFRTLSAKPIMAEASSGLGLSIVKIIAEAHGGSAVASSEGKGKGTRISIRLPRWTGEAQS